MSKQLLTDTILSHYRIVSRISAGGMGEVNLAEDVHLNRRVALKVLPDAIATDEKDSIVSSRKRAPLSALNHPNILTVYEFGL